jgi:hypothetical protein
VSRLCLVGRTVAVTSAAAQEARMPPFEKLVYLSCSEAQAVEPGKWVAVARFLADRTAADEEAVGQELGMLARGACTMFPQALLFGVIAQAVRIEAGRLAAAR